MKGKEKDTTNTNINKVTKAGDALLPVVDAMNNVEETALLISVPAPRGQREFVLTEIEQCEWDRDNYRRILERVLDKLKHHHMSRAGIKALVENAENAMKL